MKLVTRGFDPVVTTAGVHTLALTLGPHRYTLTASEARLLAQTLLKTVETQGDY